MKKPFLKNKTKKLSLSPYNHYCRGYCGQKNYITALVMGVDSVKEHFTHAGSHILDSIIAYDRAETNDIYLGQINMSIVSSFCGPEGLLWGYDLAKVTNSELSLSSFKPKGIRLRSGEGLRQASRALFGTKNEKHFPLLPGSHVPCAGRFLFKSGPTVLYSAVGIGIPENREKSACLFMEDVGELIGGDDVLKIMKDRVITNIVQSILEIGENQKVDYKEIFVDFVSKKIKPDEMGCSLIALPYFLLAQKAFNKKIFNQTLNEWQTSAKNNFLNNK